jgi:uncharacterized protein (TIGR03437 family)
LTVSASTQTYFTATTAEQSCTGSTWLTINGATTVSNYTSPAGQVITVAANPSSLTAQTCTGTIQFLANGLTQNVGVTLTIGGGLTVSPASLSFSYSGTGSNPAAKTITLTNTSAGSLPYAATATVSTPSGGTWLTFTSNSTQAISGSVLNGAPYSLLVSANPANLAAGSYTGTVAVTAGGTVTNVAVSFTVAAVVTPISATPGSLTFNYPAGGAAPAAQSISVSGGSFTASAVVTTPSGGTWLAVSPPSGTTATTLSVSLVASGLTNLTAGTYTGTITVTGTNNTTGTATITVTLTVTTPAPTITAVQNAASGGTGAVSPGEIITITGTALGPATPATLTVSNGSVTTSIGGVTVTIGGTPAPLLYVSSGQINAIVPYEVSGLLAPSLVVTYQGQSSNGYALQTVAAAPAIFTQNNSGSGLGAILNQNYTVNGPSQPASRGSTVQVFMTGEGLTTPTHVTGKVNNVTNASQLPVPLLPVSATVGSVPAAVTFAAEAPDFVSGVMQVNVVIPTTVATGNLPIVITLGTSYSTSNAVMVSVQ